MRFREMDPEDVRRLLEERDEYGVPKHQDLITPLVQKEQALFRNVTCPSCGSAGMQPFVDPRRPFVSGSVLPNQLLRCPGCRTEFDPLTRFITRFNPVPG